jgi:hypothetical protein
MNNNSIANPCHAVSPSDESPAIVNSIIETAGQ